MRWLRRSIGAIVTLFGYGIAITLGAVLAFLQSSDASHGDGGHQIMHFTIGGTTYADAPTDSSGNPGGYIGDSAGGCE